KSVTASRTAHAAPVQNKNDLTHSELEATGKMAMTGGVGKTTTGTDSATAKVTQTGRTQRQPLTLPVMADRTTQPTGPRLSDALAWLTHRPVQAVTDADLQAKAD